MLTLKFQIFSTVKHKSMKTLNHKILSCIIALLVLITNALKAQDQNLYKLSNQTRVKFKELMDEYKTTKSLMMTGMAAVIAMDMNENIQSSFTVNDATWDTYNKAVDGLSSYMHQKMATVCGGYALRKDIAVTPDDKKFWERLYKVHTNLSKAGAAVQPNKGWWGIFIYQSRGACGNDIFKDDVNYKIFKAKSYEDARTMINTEGNGKTKGSYTYKILQGACLGIWWIENNQPGWNCSSENLLIRTANDEELVIELLDRDFGVFFTDKKDRIIKKEPVQKF